jgi:hypothetical protein
MGVRMIGVRFRALAAWAVVLVAAHLAQADNEKTIVLAQGASSAFNAGLSGRRAIEQWFAELTGDFKTGASYWAGQRSVPKPGSCYASDGSSTGAWTQGCLAAQRQFAPTDVRRKAEPEYRQGWNSFTGLEEIPPPPPSIAPASAIPEQVPYTPPSPTINVDIEITPQGGGKPLIVGKTNLPDGFQAILSLQEGRRILGQRKIEVRSGQFSAGPFTLNGLAYPRGIYAVDIGSPSSHIQPPAVQAVIGPHGAFLRGPLVRLDQSLSYVDRLVDFRTSIEIR